MNLMLHGIKSMVESGDAQAADGERTFTVPLYWDYSSTSFAEAHETFLGSGSNQRGKRTG
jgi:hypothetical protein